MPGDQRPALYGGSRPKFGCTREKVAEKTELNRDRLSRSHLGTPGYLHGDKCGERSDLEMPGSYGQLQGSFREYIKVLVFVPTCSSCPSCPSCSYRGVQHFVAVPCCRVYYWLVAMYSTYMYMYFACGPVVGDMTVSNRDTTFDLLITDSYRQPVYLQSSYSGKREVIGVAHCDMKQVRLYIQSTSRIYCTALQSPEYNI